jgi:LysR family hydrogen peroxide-inducible transcriptional activator
MNTRVLEYIVTVHETKSFLEAAEKCFVSQPALSMQIKKFEDTIGIKIFERTTKSNLTTSAGIKIVNQCYKVLHEVSNLNNIAKMNSNDKQICISIGAFPTLCPYIAPIIIPIIKKHIPNINISIIEEKSNVLIDMLHKGDIDFIFLAENISSRNIRSSRIFSDIILAAISCDNQLSNKKKITIDDITNQNLFLLDEGHCLREQSIKFCSLQNYNNQNFKGSSLETLRQMVFINEGITLIPKIACINTKGIKYLEIDDDFKRDIHFMMRKSSIYKDIYKKITELFILALNNK